MKRTLFFLTGLNFFALTLGLLREAAIAYHFGTSSAADAFAVILLFIESVAAVAASGIGAYVVVPIVNRVFSQRSSAEAFALMESLCLWLTVLSVPLALAAMLKPGALINVIGPDLDTGQHELLVNLLRLSVPSVPFILLSGVTAGMLQARADYFTPVLSRAFFTGVIAVMVIAGSSRLGILAGAAGILAGSIGQLAIQLAVLSKRGWSPQLPSLSHSALGDALRFSLPALTALAATNLIMGNGQRLLALGLPEGSLAAIGYAQRILSLVANLSLAIGTVSLTEVSLVHSLNPLDQGKAEAVLGRSIQTGLFLLTPLSIILFVYAQPITAVLFQRGQFGVSSVTLTAACVRYFSFGIVPGMVLAIVLRAYPALWRPWSNAGVSLFWCGATVAATALLIPAIQTIAVPVSYSLGTLLAAVVSVLWLRSAFQRSFFTSLLWYAVRLALCGAVSAGVLLFLRGDSAIAMPLTFDSIFKQAAAVGAFSAIFISMCWACGDPHVPLIWRLAPVVRIRKQILERL